MLYRLRDDHPIEVFIYQRVDGNWRSTGRTKEIRSCDRLLFLNMSPANFWYFLAGEDVIRIPLGFALDFLEEDRALEFCV